MATDELNRDIERLVQAVQVLASDVQAAAQLSHRNDTQFARRAYVRAAFALVEGNINLMAELILAAIDRRDIQVLPKDIEILRQERETSVEGGLPIVRVKFVPIRDRSAPVFELYSRIYGKSFRLEKSTSGWGDFNTAIEIRNRITHPKNATSFTISDSELDTVERARLWFANSVEALLKECS